MKPIKKENQKRMMNMEGTRKTTNTAKNQAIKDGISQNELKVKIIIKKKRHSRECLK